MALNIELFQGNADYIHAIVHHDSCARTQYEFLIRYPKVRLVRVINQQRVSRRHRNWSTTEVFSTYSRDKKLQESPYVPRQVLEETRKNLQDRLDFDADVKVGE